MVFNCNPGRLYKFRALLYKGFLLRKRHYITTVFEVILPIFVCVIPVIIMTSTDVGRPIPKSPIPKSQRGSSKWRDEAVHPPFNPLLGGSGTKEGDMLFVYAPLNENTRVLMEDSVRLWKSVNERFKVVSKGVNDSEELEHYCISQKRSQKRDSAELFIIGTIFNDMPPTGNNLSSHLDYTIRYYLPYYSSGFSTNLKYRFSREGKTYSSTTFFLSWQAAVERTFIQKKMVEAKKSFDYELWMQEFPYPRTREINIELSDAILFPFLMSYGLIVFVCNAMQKIIDEKSTGCKELMKMMGMTDFIYWASTFLNYFIVLVVIILTVTITYKVSFRDFKVLLEHSDFSLLFILFLLYAASFLLFSFALSCFFNKAVFGILVLIVVYNVIFFLLSLFVLTSRSFFESQALELNYFPHSQFIKFCICLIPPGALLTMSEMILMYEGSGEGAQWSNLYSFDAVPDFNMSAVMIAMLVSCPLYSLIIWYVDAVWPWQYGVPKPFYFPFTKSYWTGYKEKKPSEVLLEDEPKGYEFFEDDPSGISPGVVVNNLSKVFRDGFHSKVAVNKVSLNIYNGQITALLGHNGAGKTTTINILTGLYPPSCGTASVNGYDIFAQTNQARQSLGVCPQENILYDTLTVEEHLKMYATLKGVKWNRLNKETQNVLTMLNLSGKKREIVKKLSGGMKRNLCLGIAIIGGSKVLFLDEPTSGMDVEARRNAWDALLDMRHNRTIVLTTHYMEEADILGDRIAIMADGEIQCCGSPMFLKKKFGTGYHLRLVKNENFDIDATIDIVTRCVPSAVVENDNEGETTFNLMTNNQSSFCSLFEELEQNKKSLGVDSCGVTVTTMDDVFLNIDTLRSLKKAKEEKYSVEEDDETEMKDLYVETSILGRAQIQNQFCGLFLKRFHYAKRHLNIYFLQFVLPFITILFCLSTLNTGIVTRFVSSSALKLDIKEVYGKTDGFYQSDGSTLANSVITELQNIFQNKKVNALPTDDPIQFTLNYSQKSVANYYKRLIVGGSVKAHDRLNLTAWFNGFPFHAEPMSLLLMNTAILKSVTKSGYITLTNDPLPAIKSPNDPMPYYVEDPFHAKERIFAHVFIPLALSFLSASFVLVPLHEQMSKAKLLQLMTGINHATYWLSMFAWDFLVSIAASLFLIIPFAIFTSYAFFSPHSEAIGTAVLLMILYGWCSIPFSYLFSLRIKKSSNAYLVINCLNIIIGTVVCLVLATTLTLPHIRPYVKEDKFFKWLFKLFPAYALSSGFANLFEITFSNAFCDSLSPKYLKYNCIEGLSRDNPIFKCCKDICGYRCRRKVYPLTMDDNACGHDMLFLFFDGILYFLLLLVLETPVAKSCFQSLSRDWYLIFHRVSDRQLFNSQTVVDSDVLNEEERIKNVFEQGSHNNANSLMVRNLTKLFKNIIAVDKLTFGIHDKECFGLLGVNGAGKTTTFRMLTGDCSPTKGNAFLLNCSIISNLKKFQSFIGYCPQHNALIDRLSAREMITLFARLRGLSGPYVTRYVNTLIKMTDLTEYADKPSMMYSGGNKRKLLIALALIGSPPLLLLDEPTSGVDPVSRRKIWKILSLARIYSGASVILTTHSMEEAEVLCSRLAIMVNGSFRCLGSIQHLKTKFGKGYTLIVKAKQGQERSLYDIMKGIKTHIDSNISGAILKDEHQGTLQYHIVDFSVNLSYLFKFMNEMKTNYDLEDYAISDTSLEQIFLTSAKSQRISS